MSAVRAGTLSAWARWAAAGLVLSCGPALAQTLGQGQDDGVSTWRVILALILCLALAAAVPFAMKARGFSGLNLPSLGRVTRRLRVIESVRLSQQASVSLVELDGEEFLVSVSNAGVEILDPQLRRPRSGKAEAGA